MLERVANHPEFWAYVSVPFIASLIAWATNWVAVQMTFYPLRFIGIPPFLGWQGIIPRKAVKMSGILVDSTLSKVGSISEFFQQMEPQKIAAHLTRTIQSNIEMYTDEVMTERNPVLWENLPLMVRRRIYARARRAVPQIMDNLVDDISRQVEELVDLKYMVCTQMGSDRKLMVRLFREVGDPEFRFVVNSGLYFGFLFGLVQVLVMLLVPSAWMVPIFGFIVGSATNWLALNVIFRPLNPIRIGPFRIQGLFLARQKDVAESFARLATREVVTLRNIMQQVMSGPRADRTKQLIKRHLRPLLEGGVLRTAAQLTVGPGGYAHLKRVVEEKAVELATVPFEDPQFNRERGAIVERIMCERMTAMSAEEFQALLRPAFQEDEWILIMIGGFLGALAGLAQLLILFGSRLV